MIENFIEERNKALLSLDRGKIEEFGKKYGLTFPVGEEAFWRGVHKAICNIHTFPQEVRERSAEWLCEHGSTPSLEQSMRKEPS